MGTTTDGSTEGIAREVGDLLCYFGIDGENAERAVELYAMLEGV